MHPTPPRNSLFFKAFLFWPRITATSLLQLRRPVQHQGKRIAAFLQVPAVKQKLLPVRGHVESSILALDANRLKQVMGSAKPDCVAGSIHINRHYLVGRVEKEQFLAVPAPFCRRSAIGRDLPFRASRGKGGDVNLLAA